MHSCNVGGDSAQKRKKEELPVFEQAENADNPLRCPVKLYEFYLSKWYDVLFCFLEVYLSLSIFIAAMYFDWLLYVGASLNYSLSLCEPRMNSIDQ